ANDHRQGRTRGNSGANQRACRSRARLAARDHRGRAGDQTRTRRRRPEARQGRTAARRAPHRPGRRSPGGRLRGAHRRRTKSLAVSVFLDTSVLLAGLVDFGPQSGPAQSLLHAVAEKGIQNPATAWHCCLEFFSVATRLPPEFRVAPADAATLLEEEVFARMAVHDLPAADRVSMLRAVARDAIAGGRIYDAHIAEVA